MGTTYVSQTSTMILNIVLFGKFLETAIQAVSLLGNFLGQNQTMQYVRKEPQIVFTVDPLNNAG